jgi:hypothetical protein
VVGAEVAETPKPARFFSRVGANTVICFVGAAAEPDGRIGSAEWVGVGVWEGGACGAAEGIALGGVLPRNRDRDLQVNKRTE